MKTLARYFPVLLRDVLLTRGAAMAFVLLTFLLPPLFLGDPEPPPEMKARMVVGVVRGTVVFLTLVGTFGVAGQDFRSGSFRVLFARPVHSGAYYLAAFAAALLAFLTVQFLGVFVALMLELDVLSTGLVLDVTFTFLLLGSLVFAFSRLTRLGWLLAFFLFSLAQPLRQAYPAGETWYGSLYNVVLPPSHLLSPVAQHGPGAEAALITAAGPEWGAMLWLAGYTLLALGLGVALVRRLPMVWS